MQRRSARHKVRCAEWQVVNGYYPFGPLSSEKAESCDALEYLAVQSLQEKTRKPHSILTLVNVRR